MSGDSKWQIFIGNVSSSTTDERLRQVFSTVGHVVNVRVMTDRGDPKKGYAFVEYDNPDTALTAIQNLGNVEVDGRRLRVGFSNNSGLEAIAKQRGLTITPNGGVTGKNLEGVLANFPLPDMYDMIAHLKETAETKPEELRLLLISHPQIAEAIVHMQVKIGMIRPLARASDQQPYQQQQQQQQQLPQPLQLQPPVHLGAFGQQQQQQQQQQQPHVGGLAAAGSYYQAQPPPHFPPQQVGGWSGQMPPLPPPVPFDPSAAAGGGGGGAGGGLGALGAMLAGGNQAMAQETLRQVMSMTPEQLAGMEPGQRQLMMELQQAVLMQTQQAGGMR